MESLQKEALFLVDTLLLDLEKFQEFKANRWGEIQESIQEKNKLGVPTEDWIIPPDETKVLDLLEKDSQYVELRASILSKSEKVNRMAQDYHFDTHHKLDWLKFTEPLLGNDALEDAEACLKEFAAFIRNH